MSIRCPNDTHPGATTSDDQNIHVALVGNISALSLLTFPWTGLNSFVWCRYDTVDDLRRALSDSRVDVVLIDHKAQALMDSFRRAVDSTIPVMVIASQHHEDDAVAALDTGADMYVTPAMPVAEIMARLSALVRRSRYPSTFNANHPESKASEVSTLVD